MNRIERSFAKLLDLPCWGVSRGFGSFVTLEFGSPHLVVRDPIDVPSETSMRVKRVLARRSARVYGDWHLWIYCCQWRVETKGRLVGDWTTSRRIERAVRELNGQKLQEVAVRSRGAATRFSFDLETVLETKPYDRGSEQWHLYEPNGNVLTWRADRRWRYKPSTSSRHESGWRNL